MGGKREVVRDLVDECNAEPNERILLLGAQPREKRDMVFRWLRVAVAEELTWTRVQALRAWRDVGRARLRQSFPLGLQKSGNVGIQPPDLPRLVPDREERPQVVLHPAVAIVAVQVHETG